MWAKRFLRERDQHRVAAEPNDGLMKLDIDLGIFIQPRMQLAVLEGGEHGTQRRDLVLLRALGDQARRHALERGPGGDHLDHSRFDLRMT